MEWWVDGFRHRDGDKPAFIDPLGTQEWWRWGVLHRDDDKPAVILQATGKCWWWVDGRRHRNDDADGVPQPAVTTPNGLDEYWYHGCKYTYHRYPKRERKRARY